MLQGGQTKRTWMKTWLPLRAWHTWSQSATACLRWHTHTYISHDDDLTYFFKYRKCVFYNTTITPTNLIFCFYLPFQLSLKQTTNCFIFPQIPHEMVTQSRNSYVEAELQAPTIEELCKRQHQEEEREDEGSWPAFMEARLQGLLKESREKAKGWVSCQSTGNTELSYKKVRLENSDLYTTGHKHYRKS